MYALTVRFDLEDEKAAQGFDQLVRETLPGIQNEEPGTWLYIVHTVHGAPLARIFYEVYADKKAFEDHGEQPHTKRFLAEREQYYAQGKKERVEYLTPTGGKNLPRGS